jgi:CheY-like chemotaxis protein
MEQAFPHAGSQAPVALVIDDSLVERMLATAILQKLGFAVICVASAEQALLRMAGTRFDLVLCDLCLPDMDGVDLLAAMRTVPQLQPPPCIVLSAHDDGLFAQAALRAGASAYLVKPLQLATLRSALETLSR